MKRALFSFLLSTSALVLLTLLLRRGPLAVGDAAVFMALTWLCLAMIALFSLRVLFIPWLENWAREQLLRHQEEKDKGTGPPP